MKTFILDLWTDLRDRRLWPVAALLVAGLVAVPLVLKKSSEEPTPVAPVPAQTRNAPEPKQLKALANVKLEEAEAGDGSSLDTFDPDNPFRPPAGVIEASKGGADDGAAPSAPSDSSGVTGDTGAAPGGTDTGSGTGDSGGTGDTRDPGDGDGNGDGDETTTTQFTYVIDVTFTANGRTRKVKGMQRLDMLPSAASPLLLFLGVSANAGNAVFLVDSTLQTAGEGKCKPSPSECAFLYLGAGSEHAFTNADGDSYQLKIDQIRKVKVDGKSASASSKRDRRAGAAVGAPATQRRFVPPLLADLVSVSSATVGDSNRNQDRR
jgi:hypothetical protein